MPSALYSCVNKMFYLWQRQSLKKVWAIGVSCITLTGLSACDTNDQEIADNSIIYCAEGSPESFNPQLVTSGTTIDATANQLYDRLITFDNNDNTIAPGIAKSWHLTRDGKMVTFYLRKDVAFHSTDYFTPSRTLNADDVIFSFNRVLDEHHPYHHVSGGRYPYFQNVQFNEIVQEVEKINDYTVRFKLNKANSSFLANLATDFAVILSAEYGQHLADINQKSQIDIKPIGTGPFKLVNYKSGSLIRYYKHPLYWREKVAIEQLVYDITASNYGRLTKLLTNECDVIAYPIAHNKIDNNPELNLEEVTSFNIGYLGFNTQKPPFDNVNVRTAIAHAINRQSIIETVYSGRADIANSILPKNSWASDKTLPAIEYSPTKAKQMLTDAGFPDGFTMDIWAMPVQRAYNPNALTMAKLIQSDLSEIGVTVNIVSYEWVTFLRRLALGEHQSVLLGWSADHPDPDNFLTPLLSCNSIETGSNRVFWCNNEFDTLLQQSLNTTNVSQRKQFYTEAQQIIAKQLPLIPIAHSKRYQARNKRIEGKLLNSFGGISFAQAVKN